MKKFIVLLAALFVVALSFGVAAEKTYYWEGLLNNAEIEYAEGHGEFGYNVRLMEFNAGKAIDNGIENYLFLNFGITPKTQFETYLDAYRGYMLLSGKVKHQFVNTRDFDFAVAGRLDYFNEAGLGDRLSPAVTVLFDNLVTNNVKLHNNLDFAFVSGGNVIVSMDNGLVYAINPKNTVKVNLESTFNRYNDFVLSAAYKAVLTNQFNYILNFRKDFGLANTRFENILEFTPTNDFKLTGNLRLNTNYASRIIVRADKAITKNFGMNMEFGKDLRDWGYSYLHTGMNIKF